MRKTAYFSLSGALILENLRRFWAIPVLSFLGYFFAGVFPILLNYSRLSNNTYLLDSVFANSNPIYGLLLFLIPIASAVVVFSYLQNTPSTTTMHSLPFTRARLFNSNMLSGLILTAAPVIETGIIYHLLSKPVYDFFYDENGAQILLKTNNHFSHESIWLWIGATLLGIAIVYIISVFAGMVTGTSLHHTLAATGFNFIAPGLFICGVLYCGIYIFGYNMDGSWIDMAFNLCPAANILYKGGQIGAASLIAYLLTFLVLLVLSAVLYQKRTMEKAGDAITFRFLIPVLGFILTFLGMSAMGFFFSSLEEYSPGHPGWLLYLGFAVGAVIFWFISRMLLKKTVRVFNKASLRLFAIYLLAAILFVLGMLFDVTGMEKRVPSAESVSSVEFYTPVNHYGAVQTIVLEEEDNIRELLALHKDMTGCESRFNDEKAQTTHYAVTFTYNKKILPLSRSYDADYEFLLENEHMKRIMESEEYRSKTSPTVELTEDYKLTSADLYSNETGSNTAFDLKTDQAQIMNILHRLDQEYHSMPYSDLIHPARVFANISLSFEDRTLKNPDGSVNRRYVDFSLSDCFADSIRLMEESGYLEGIRLQAEDVTSASVYPINQDSQAAADARLKASGYDPDMAAAEINYNDGLTKENRPVKTITDKAQIQALLDSGSSDFLSSETWYYVNFTYNTQNYNYSEKYGASEEEDYETMLTLYYPPEEPALGL